MMYTRPSICQSLSFILATSLPMTPQSISHFFSMEMTTNQSVVDQEEAQRWGWFRHQMSSGHKESQTKFQVLQSLAHFLLV